MKQNNTPQCHREKGNSKHSVEFFKQKENEREKKRIKSHCCCCCCCRLYSWLYFSIRSSSFFLLLFVFPQLVVDSFFFALVQFESMFFWTLSTFFAFFLLLVAFLYITFSTIYSFSWFLLFFHLSSYLFKLHVHTIWIVIAVLQKHTIYFISYRIFNIRLLPTKKKPRCFKLKLVRSLYSLFLSTDRFSKKKTRNDTKSFYATFNVLTS